MADKKVERNVRSSDIEHPHTPTEKLTSSLSAEGTLNTEHPRQDKAKAELLDKFRERDERYRREQATESEEQTGQEDET